jgi:hypothetical protein
MHIERRLTVDSSFTWWHVRFADWHRMLYKGSGASKYVLEEKVSPPQLGNVFVKKN